MKAYLLKCGQLNKSTNQFEFYDFDIFSSKKKALADIKNRIDVNKGFCVSEELINIGDVRHLNLQVTYDCMSAPFRDELSRPMKIRYCLYKKEMK